MKEAAVLNSVNCYRPVTIKFLLLRAITTISSLQVWLLKPWFYRFLFVLIDCHILSNSSLIKGRHQRMGMGGDTTVLLAFLLAAALIARFDPEFMFSKFEENKKLVRIPINFYGRLTASQAIARQHPNCSI